VELFSYFCFIVVYRVLALAFWAAAAIGSLAPGCVTACDSRKRSQWHSCQRFPIRPRACQSQNLRVLFRPTLYLAQQSPGIPSSVESDQTKTKPQENLSQAFQALRPYLHSVTKLPCVRLNYGRRCHLCLMRDLRIACLRLCLACLMLSLTCVSSMASKLAISSSEEGVPEALFFANCLLKSAV
jgi:hypothetical protein